MIAFTQVRNLVGGFLESSEHYPARPALVVGDRSLTYSELRTQAAKIGRAIQQYDDTDSALVAVLAARSIAAYSGILGALMAGKGYVPLNPKFPVERTRRMLEKSGCHTVVVGSECIELLSKLMPLIQRNLTIILPDVRNPGNLPKDFPACRFAAADHMASDSSFTPACEVDSNATAYLLFTSGSTGEPKGVPISHANVSSYLQYTCDRYEITEEDRCSQEFDLTFDLSVHDLFVCWERGACLHVVPGASVMAPAKFIRDSQLTMWFSVPSVIGFLMKLNLLSAGSFPSLRYSLFCGEPLSMGQAIAWQESSPNSVLENLYGPTEATIAISNYRWDQKTSPGQCVNGIVPIGWMFDGQRCRIIDGDGYAVPHGESGELCLAGSQLSSGYWHDSERTAERFVKCPDTRGAIWYRTGDVARQDSGGCLYYLGRTDHQVKIRGHRVELQEIEAVLRRACGTEQVVAVARSNGEGSSDGVFAFASGVETLDEAGILAACADSLPDYMVPRKIFLRDELPLNSNGKIDRLQLQNSLSSAIQ